MCCKKYNYDTVCSFYLRLTNIKKATLKIFQCFFAKTRYSLHNFSQSDHSSKKCKVLQNAKNCEDTDTSFLRSYFQRYFDFEMLQ